jgi:tungstate transport system ATP-binding protein
MNIEITDASKEYNGKEVLYIDKLKFRQGATYALMGLNGSGKTTLLHCMSRIESFTRGDVLYDGFKDVDSVRKNISIMLQKPYLFNCSVLENIELGLKFRKYNEKDIRERIDRYISYFDISGIIGENSRHLSGGEQAKAALLRVAVLETKVTFLDEPTASMDIESTLRAEELIKDMSSGDRSIIIVTHDLMQAKRIADYIIFLDKGRVIEQGEKNEIFDHPKHDLLKKILNKDDCK